jgi:hypothetical protein
MEADLARQIGPGRLRQLRQTLLDVHERAHSARVRSAR